MYCTGLSWFWNDGFRLAGFEWHREVTRGWIRRGEQPPHPASWVVSVGSHGAPQEHGNHGSSSKLPRRLVMHPLHASFSCRGAGKEEVSLGFRLRTIPDFVADRCLHVSLRDMSAHLSWSHHYKFFRIARASSGMAWKYGRATWALSSAPKSPPVGTRSMQTSCRFRPMKGRSW